MKPILSILLIFMLVMGCSSVKNRYGNKQSSQKPSTSLKADDKSKMSNNIKSDNIEQDDKAKTKSLKEKSNDTTYVYLQLDEYSRENILQKEFENSIVMFDKQQYKKACPKFKFLSNTIDPNDSLFYEVNFFNCECLIIDEKFTEAEEMLKYLLNNKKTPDPVLQKVLVRLGHIYCVRKNPQEAEKMFNRLKKQFPNSEYINVANCNSVIE